MKKDHRRRAWASNALYDGIDQYHRPIDFLLRLWRNLDCGWDNALPTVWPST
jgi:hypothetical protein